MAILIIIGACLFIGVIIGVSGNAKAKREIEKDYKHKEQMGNADITQPPYNIGEYYNDGKHQGYVFSIKDGGYHGKIIALHENEGQWSLTKKSYGSTLSKPILASSYTSGKINKQTIENIGITIDYPIIEAIKYSFAYSKKDFFLPSIEELMELSKCRSLINSNIESRRYTYVSAEKISDGYLSSTELENKILYFHFLSNSIWKEDKDSERYYRLVYEF